MKLHQVINDEWKMHRRDRRTLSRARAGSKFREQQAEYHHLQDMLSAQNFISAQDSIARKAMGMNNFALPPVRARPKAVPETPPRVEKKEEAPSPPSKRTGLLSYFF